MTLYTVLWEVSRLHKNPRRERCRILWAHCYVSLCIIARGVLRRGRLAPVAPDENESQDVRWWSTQRYVKNRSFNFLLEIFRRRARALSLLRTCLVKRNQSLEVNHPVVRSNSKNLWKWEMYELIIKDTSIHIDARCDSCTQDRAQNLNRGLVLRFIHGFGCHPG
jgi:hypothetical protein